MKNKLKTKKEKENKRSKMRKGDVRQGFWPRMGQGYHPTFAVTSSDLLFDPILQPENTSAATQIYRFSKYSCRYLQYL